METKQEVKKSWEELISQFILIEAKLSDSAKVNTLTKKLGDPYLNESSKRSPQNIFINYVVRICDNIAPATHISKITHSSNNGSSIIDQITDSNSSYLSSNSAKRFIDGSYDNAALSAYVKFLMIQNEKEYLFQKIIEDSSILQPFAIDANEASFWHRSFQENKALHPRSDALNKQIYFPVGQDYHLLQVLKSSSLLQAIQMTSFDKDSRKVYDKAKKSRNKRKYCSTQSLHYPRLAKLKTVQSQPQNVSVLNGGRSGGRITLFSCAPPIWKPSLKPPRGKSLFNGEFQYYPQTNTCLDIITAYLTGYELAGLSQRHPDKYKKLERLVNQLVDSLCDYTARIHQLDSGWSKDSQLKISHQHWLDPYRKDLEYQQSRGNNHYLPEIVEDFAKWLNSQLRKREKGLSLGKEQQQLWEKMTKENFRKFHALID